MVVVVPGTISAHCVRNKNWSQNNTMPLKKSDTISCLSIQMTVDILVFLVGNTELNCYDDKSEHTFKVLTINFWKYLATRRHFLSCFCAFFGQIARVYVFTKRNYLPALQDEIHILPQQSLAFQFTIGSYHISSKFWRKCDMSSFCLFLLLFFFVLYCTPWPDARPFTEGKKMKRKCNFHLEKSRKGGSCINNSVMELNQCYVHSLKRACVNFLCQRPS